MFSLFINPFETHNTQCYEPESEIVPLVLHSLNAILKEQFPENLEALVSY